MHILDYLAIPVAHATAPKPIKEFVGKVNTLIINPLIVLMFAAALLYFLYGVFQFLVNADQSEDRETGRQHMLWGVIGMFLMFAVFAILHIIQNTVGGTPVDLNLQ